MSLTIYLATSNTFVESLVLSTDGQLARRQGVDATGVCSKDLGRENYLSIFYIFYHFHQRDQ